MGISKLAKELSTRSDSGCAAPGRWFDINRHGLRRCTLPRRPGFAPLVSHRCALGSFIWLPATRTGAGGARRRVRLAGAASTDRVSGPRRRLDGPRRGRGHRDHGRLRRWCVGVAVMPGLARAEPWTAGCAERRMRAAHHLDGWDGHSGRPGRGSAAEAPRLRACGLLGPPVHWVAQPSARRDSKARAARWDAAAFVSPAPPGVPAYWAATRAGC